MAPLVQSVGACRPSRERRRTDDVFPSKTPQPPAPMTTATRPTPDRPDAARREGLRALGRCGVALCGAAALGGLVACANRTPAPLPPPAASVPVPGSAPGPARGAGVDFAWTRDAESAFTAFNRFLGAGPIVRRSDDDRVWVVLPGEHLYPDGRAALAPAAQRWLDQVALVMKAWPASEARLVGHADPRGSAAANDALSLERAQSARDWLVGRGVAARRLTLAGRGSRDAGAPGGDRRLEVLLGERGR